MLRPLPDEQQIPPGILALLLALQQVQIAPDSGEGGAQIVGHARDRLLEGAVALLVALPLLPQQAQLAVEPGGQTAHGAVPAGDGQQGVGVRLQPLLEPPADLLRRAAQEQDFPHQEQDRQGQDGAEYVHHGNTPAFCRYPFFSFEKEKNQKKTLRETPFHVIWMVIISDPCAGTAPGRS